MRAKRKRKILRKKGLFNKGDYFQERDKSMKANIDKETKYRPEFRILTSKASWTNQIRILAQFNLPVFVHLRLDLVELGLWCYD